MDDDELRRTTSYHSRQTELQAISAERAGHVYGNIYASGSSILQLGDSGHSYILEEKQKKSDLQSVKNALYYDTIDDRRARLKSVSEASIAWVWSTSFTVWLTKTPTSSSDVFFWIVGKPGSGKSTLLNCLSSSRQTTELLQSNGDDWMTVEFYFDDSAGAAIANSIKGMLRSFIFQLVNELAILGHFVHDKYSHALRGGWLEHDSELISTLRAVLKLAPVKVCAFIDGIDELTGTPRDLVSTLLNIQEGIGMKICLASRPDKKVERAVARLKAPSFQVEDHNAATIQNYIQSVCEELTEEEIESSRPLWQLIEKEANGIILWARFVVDELLDQLVVGATMTELEDILNTFPTEMEAVYERVLRDLTEEQRLHAAVAFYIIEHGLTSIRSSHEVPIYDFFVTWTVMVESLSQGIKFDSKFDIKQFKIRIEAMLGGLLEFAPSGVVRFVHTTFESYLRQTQAFGNITENIIAPAYKDGLAGQAFLHLISKANKQVTIDMTELDIGNIDDDYSQPLLQQELLLHMSPKDPKGHFSHRLEFLLTAIGRLGQVLLDSESQASTVWAVVNSSVFELHQVLCEQAGCGCNQDFRSNSTFWRDRWCLHFLASHGLLEAFRYGIRETKRQGRDAHVDMLEVTIDVVRKAQLELRQVSSMADMSKPKRHSFAISGPGLVDLLLADESLNSSHLAICQIIDFPEEPQFAKRIRQIPPSTDYRSSIPCTWFPYPSANLLCCWAWCSDDCYGRHDQASRLRSLLELDFDVNAQAYAGGTVLHALFDNQEPVPISSHTRLHHITWPFSPIKFNLIREAGYDFSGPRADDLLACARRFRDNLVGKMPWFKLRSAESMRISDLDFFIQNVLEPLCKPRFTTIWRIGTPPPQQQSPSRGSPGTLPIRISHTARGGRSQNSHDSVRTTYGPFLLET